MTRAGAMTAYPTVTSPARWLELALDYRCNLRCLGCHACNDTGETMATRAALEALRGGRAAGRTRLWLGGGEPTLRDDLFTIIHGARQLGYDDVLLQTNGMRLAYAAYRDALLAAGVTEVRVNVKSHRADVHDRLSGAPCHALLLDALAGLAGKVPLTADVLLTRSTLVDLPAVVDFYAALGVQRFELWLLSAADTTDDTVIREVPSFAEVTPALVLAAASAERAGVTITTLHTPPCTLPHPLRSLFVPASSLGLLVTTPDGRAFPLEVSSFEGGTFGAACAACRERPRCPGVRADYVRIHGLSELVPIS